LTVDYYATCSAASLGTITKYTVVAIRIVGSTVAARTFATGIVGATNTIVAVNGCARLTVEARVTGLGTVAVLTVVAIGIVGCIVTGIGAFVARIVGTIHTIIAINDCTGLAIKRCVTNLGTVAVLTVIAVGIV